MTTAIAKLRTAIRADGFLEKAASRRAVPYWFLAPYLLFFVVFYGWPMVWAPWMSLHEFTFTGSEWVGLANYEEMLTARTTWESMYNTIFIAVIKMPVTVGFALVLASVVNSQYIKHKQVLRTAILSPMTLSGVVLALLFILLLDQFGLVNYLLGSAFGFPNLNWLSGDPNVARIAVALTMLIPGTANNFIFFLAGLIGVPEHLYQAAKVDGASRLQQFRHITIPQLRPMLVLVVLLETNVSMQMFAEPQVLTNGGPQGATTTIVLRLYRVAFNELNLGYAAALGVLLTVFLATLLIVEYVVGEGDVR